MSTNKDELKFTFNENHYYFTLLALLFIGSLAFKPYPGSYVVKILPIVELMFVAFRARFEGRGWLILALLLGGWGDILLDLEPEKLFIGGLASFLAGHLCYLRILIPKFRYDTQQIPKVIAIAIASLCLSIPILYSLSGTSPDLITPVAVYMTVLISVGILANLILGGNALLAVGALSFIISDALIAYNKFVFPIPFAPYLIMLTYYFAQFGLVYGILQLKGASYPIKK